MITEYKGNVQSGQKYFQIIYVIQSYYLEYIKNSFYSTATENKQLN